MSAKILRFDNIYDEVFFADVSSGWITLSSGKNPFSIPEAQMSHASPAFLTPA